MPQLGVLSEVHPEAAMQVFERDCLIHLGSVLAIEGTHAKSKARQGAFDIEITFDDNTKSDLAIQYGEIKKINLPPGKTAKYVAHPSKFFDLGSGKGKDVEGILHGGVVGVILDGRGRPLELPSDKEIRIEQLSRWFTEMDLYPSFSK